MRAAARIVAMLCGLAIGGSILADEAADDDANLELLEYLGSWEGDDDEWHEFFDSIPPELAEGAENQDTTDRSTERDSE